MLGCLLILIVVWFIVYILRVFFNLGVEFVEVWGIFFFVFLGSVYVVLCGGIYGGGVGIVLIIIVLFLVNFVR